MSPIKKFIDKIATLDGRNSREVILTMVDAKELRDEISKLLVDQKSSQSSKIDEVITVEVRGGSFK
jgi:hypothetical protein